MEERRLSRTDDRFGLVLVFVLLTIIAVAFLASDRLGRIFLGVLPTATLIVTMYAVRVPPRRLMAITAGLVAVETAVVALAVVTGSRVGTLIAYGLAVGVTITTIALVARRIVRHGRVTMQTVFGGLAIYLQIGVMFSVVYSGLPLLTGTPFFIASRPIGPSDFLYYSIVTLTTVGYGDITAAEPIGRMLSVTEALLGQIYLVTVVAVLVGNLGAEKRSLHAEKRPGDE